MCAPEVRSAHDGPSPALVGCPASIAEVLDRHLDQRCAEAARADDRFARDIADRLAGLVRRGGKRLRPAFLYWGWRAASPAAEEAPVAVLRAAAALELIQACALVHDDVMDDSPLRRGGPSFHEAAARGHRTAGLRGDAAVFGRSAALLAGDLALVWADDLWETSGVGATARRRAHPMWRAMRTEMVAGQYRDLHGQASGVCDPRQALRIAHLKSGSYTVERPLLLGAALAGAGRATVDALRTAGRAAGEAFQLGDDLLGVFGDPDTTGKPAGEDIRHGKCTYLTALAVQRARDRHLPDVEHLLLTALGDRDLSEPALRQVRAALHEVGAPEAVRTRVSALLGTALTALKDPAIAPEAAEGVAELVRTVAAIPA